jgi:hypothetical protein
VEVEIFQKSSMRFNKTHSLTYSTKCRVLVKKKNSINIFGCAVKAIVSDILLQFRSYKYGDKRIASMRMKRLVV